MLCDNKLVRTAFAGHSGTRPQRPNCRASEQRNDLAESEVNDPARQDVFLRRSVFSFRTVCVRDKRRVRSMLLARDDFNHA